MPKLNNDLQITFTRPRFATYERVRAHAKKNEIMHVKVVGDCMEGAGIEDGDILVVDLRKMPLKGDAVSVYIRSLNCVGVKEYFGAWGPFQWVSTCCASVHHKDGLRLNQMAIADHIFGVAFACYSPDKKLKWKRDISDRPEELSMEQVITGGNIGEPVLRGAAYVQ